jgi:hypothetical protein
MSRSRTTITHEEPWHEGEGWPTSTGARWPKPMAGQPSMLAGRPPNVANGAPAPLVSSSVLSKAFSKSIKATKEQHVTFVGEGSLSGRIALVTDAVDNTLKDSIKVRKISFGVGGKMKRKGMSSGFEKRRDHLLPELFSWIFPITEM